MATSNDLNISQAGYVAFDGTATFTGRTFQAGSGISLTNASGVVGDTTIATDGAVVGKTITGNTGGALSPTAGNWNILGEDLANGNNASVTSGSGSTLTVNSINCAKWIVDATAGRGTHTTIQAAITAASSGQTIFVRPGTYTENLTLKAGVSIVAFLGDADIPSVTIVGKMSYSSAGRTNISNIRLTTNGDYFLEVTGSASSVVNLNNCYLNCLNFTGINFTTSGASSEINIFDCSGNIATTGIALFTSTSPGLIFFNYCNFGNTGSSTTSSTSSAGTVVLRYTYFPNPITTSGTAWISVSHSNIIPTTNTKCITLGGSSASTISNSTMQSGTAVAISVNASTLTMMDCVLNSTNTNVIDGAGTLVYAGLQFSNTSSNIAVTTQTLRNEGPSKTIGSANSGNTNTFTVTNSSNTASSSANIVSTVGGGTAGDATYQAVVGGVQTWTWGVDNSDSDAWVLSKAATLGGADNVMRSDITGRINYPLQPSFMARATLQSDVTGDGTSYPITFTNEIFDQGGDFNGTSMFTAPVTGHYLIGAIIQYTELQAATTAGAQTIVTSNRNYSFASSFATIRNSGNAANIPISTFADMDTGDTASIIVSVSNGTKTVDVTANSTFYASLLN